MAASLQLFSHVICNTNTSQYSISSSSNLAPKPVFASSIFTSNSIKSARKFNNHLNSTSDHRSFSDINHFQINKSPLVVVDHQEEDDVDDQPLKIGIIGFGNFGQFIAKALQRQGHLVLATSRSDYSDYCHQRGIEFFRSIEGLCEEQPDVVLVCSSILSTESLVRAIPMEKLKPDTIFADVLSVKQFPRNLFLEVLPQGFGIVSTHPMFGPESGKHGWQGLPFVFDKVRATTPHQHAKCNQFLNIFENEGCRMVEMSCEEHDRHAAGSQFITHTIGRILSHLDLESTPINTKGYETLLQLTDNTLKDSFDLYYGLFMYNVNAQEQIENLDRAFDTVKQKLFGRLHDILRKQIVERVPLQTGPPPMNTSIGEANTTTPTPTPAYNFLPNHDEMKDLSSFAIPSSTGTEYSASQSKDSSSHASTTR